MTDNRDYINALIEALSDAIVQSLSSTDPLEIVIGVGPAFQSEIHETINGLSHNDILREICAGVEEEGMHSRVMKVFRSSDVAFIGKEAATQSGSGIGIGLQSKGTAVIHQRDLNTLTNLELFPQAPLLTLEHYRMIGRNAACYVAGKNVTPIKPLNDPMIRAKFQVKAAIMHIKETEAVVKHKPSIVWGG